MRHGSVLEEAGIDLSLAFPRGQILPHDIEDAYQMGLYTLPESCAFIPVVFPWQSKSTNTC